MQAIVLRCADGTRFRLGETSLESVSPYLHADTLFSALCNVYAQVHDDAEGFIDLVRSGRLRFSSGFFAVECSWLPGRYLYFVPRPPLRYGKGEVDPKKLRRIKFVSLGVLGRIGQSLKPGDIPKAEIDLASLPTIGTAFACTPEELGPDAPADLLEARFHSVEAETHVLVHQPSRTDALYQEANLTFRTAHLYTGASAFYIRGHFYVLCRHTLDSNEWRRFLGCLRILADEGVGGSRSGGCGQFEDVEVRNDVAVQTSTQAGLYLSLAPTVPEDDSAFAAARVYDLMTRAGGHAGPARHRRVRMIREGALFDRPIDGRLVEVTPETSSLPHPIYRSGLSFTLPLGTADA
ncbi:MAG: type III-A CRISPR-associated RAMP protein Csm4 [Rhodothermaceae bacterium]|nr:MAG: type III-A CRISPR-associated RAMP protein Csm4 [Rhodothermaceae bacterium]